MCIYIYIRTYKYPFPSAKAPTVTNTELYMHTWMVFSTARHGMHSRGGLGLWGQQGRGPPSLPMCARGLGVWGFGVQGLGFRV